MSELTVTKPSPTHSATPTGLVAQLSVLYRFLAAWIGLAMAGGLVLGRVWPGTGDVLDELTAGSRVRPWGRDRAAHLLPHLLAIPYRDPEAP